MKILRLIFLVILTLIIANTNFSQTRTGGKVVEIVDGKTVVIEMQNRNRIVAELQYVEVPERGQPLNQIAKEHLQISLSMEMKVKADKVIIWSLLSQNQRISNFSSITNSA